MEHLKKILDLKIKEHQLFIDEILPKIDTLKVKVQGKNPLKDKDSLMQLIALKERLSFHRAAVLVLEDVKKEFK